MRLVCILTHGLGDFYPILAALPTIMKERGVKNEDLKVYIDTVYNGSPDLYATQIEAGNKMVECITQNYERVPFEFSGSHQWYGLPAEDYHTGPVYSKIKNDFIFYRLDRFKNYMRERIQPDDIVIYGPGMWAYEWKNGENIPLDMSSSRLSVLNIPTSHIGGLLGPKHVLIQVRSKTSKDTDRRFMLWIDACIEYGLTPVLIGLRDEVKLPPNKAVDLRQGLTFADLMRTTLTAEYAITTGSVIGYHRTFSEGKTVYLLPYCMGEPQYTLPDGYKKGVCFDSNNDIDQEVINVISQWGKDV